MPGITSATSLFRWEPEATFVGREAGLWERVERLVDRHPSFRQEEFKNTTLHQDPWIVKWFGGTPAPHSKRFLLHFARDFAKYSDARPILLVHGAADNANRAWIHPWEATLPDHLKESETGFALRFPVTMGRPVFAITFAHPHGDNFFQAEQVANAIQRIRVVLGRQNDSTFQVDVVAHSKGTVAVRLYGSDGRSLFPSKTFLSPYRGDIRTYVSIAAPHRGIDVPFRYYGYNLQVVSADLNAPLGAEELVIWGRWRNMTDSTLFTDTRNCFPGQAQLLYNLVRDGSVPLGADSFTGDANGSMKALYFGGKTSFVRSRGIDEAIDHGERLIYRLEERGLEPSIRLGVIVGTSPFITYPMRGVLIPMWWELMTPPGDGVVFLSSSLHTAGILRRGAKLIGKAPIHHNHVDVARKPEVAALIERWLR